MKAGSSRVCMEIRSDAYAALRRLTLASDLTIYSSGALKQPLLEAITGCQALEIEAADITEIDTAGLQLLLLVKRESARMGKQVRIVSPSKALQDVLTAYCLTTALEGV